MKLDSGVTFTTELSRGTTSRIETANKLMSNADNPTGLNRLHNRRGFVRSVAARVRSGKRFSDVTAG